MRKKLIIFAIVGALLLSVGFAVHTISKAYEAPDTSKAEITITATPDCVVAEQEEEK